MNKVAIMTWFSYHNFGSSLQVTALSKVINNLGYDASVINYIPHGKVVSLNGYNNIGNLYLNKIKRKFKNINVKEINDEKRKSNFNEYLHKNIKLTYKCKTESELFELNDEFDTFVCGSDQIWAPSCFNPKYFLNFVKDTNKKIAYAPSIGLSKIEDKYARSRMRECIKDFKHLSIREEQGKKLIKELCGKEAKVVLDPTLLLTSKEWDLIVNNSSNGEYILCYFLGDNADTWNHVKKLCEKTGLKIKIIPVFYKDLKRGFETISGVGPAEFLSLIKGASFVCTDSFHGTVFSITYEKPFYTYERFSNKDGNSQNSRIYNILSITNLRDRLILDKTKLNNNPLVCGFNEARESLDIKRNESIEYLKNSLNESIKKEKSKYEITNTCCGCSTCVSVCGKNAINIKRNKSGFLKAVIDHSKCVECGLCKKVCPYNNTNGIEIDKNNHKLFMLKSNEESVLKKSSSGGAGYEISRYLCSEGYDVIGCSYNKESKEAEHKLIKAKNIDDLHIFQGSKYIQSNITQAIRDEMLSCEKAVVFGTPCQISGIDKLLKLKRKRDNFILIDLICHGVPSRNLWKKYLKEGSKKYEYGTTPEVEFRDKSKGWRSKNIKVYDKNNTYSYPDNKDLFYRFFELGHSYGDFCFECRYRTSSAADIRIGDYWGPRYKKDKDGVSMVIALSNKGVDLLTNMYNLGKINIEEMNCSEYWTVQYPENPIKPLFYDELINDLADHNIILNDIANKYCKEFEVYKSIDKTIKPIRLIYKTLRRR